MYNITVPISNDPITGFKRKVDIQWFNWNISVERMQIHCMVVFYDANNNPILNKRVAPYTVTLTANNTPDEDYPDGEYNYFIQQYASNPIVLPAILSGIVTSRDQDGKFNI